MIWISFQDEGRMPWEREEFMISVTKEQSSFAHFFKTKGGIPRELELEAGLNTEGFKRGRGRRTGVSVGTKMNDLLRASTFMLPMLR